MPLLLVVKWPQCQHRAGQPLQLLVDLNINIWGKTPFCVWGNTPFCVWGNTLFFIKIILNFIKQTIYFLFRRNHFDKNRNVRPNESMNLNFYKTKFAQYRPWLCGIPSIRREIKDYYEKRPNLSQDIIVRFPSFIERDMGEDFPFCVNLNFEINIWTKTAG